MAESRFEVAQGESLRHRLRVEHLERELKEIHDSLSAARERMQVCFQSQRTSKKKPKTLALLICSIVLSDTSMRICAR